MYVTKSYGGSTTSFGSYQAFGIWNLHDWPADSDFASDPSFYARVGAASGMAPRRQSDLIKRLVMHGVAVGDNLDFSFGRVRGVGGGYSFDPLSIRDAEVGILNFDRAQLVHHGTKKEGFTDTQIRDGFVWWIEQPHEEPGKKKGWVARRSANIGMNLFRNDPLLEKAVLDAQLNPGVYEKSPDMANAVARYGSEGLIGEFRCAGIGIPSSGAAIDEGRVPEESGFRRPGPTWSRSFPGDPAVASDGQSHSDGMAASLAFLPLVAGWLLVGLGVVMMAAALLCRRRMAENDSIGCCSAFVCA